MTPVDDPRGWLSKCANPVGTQQTSRHTRHAGGTKEIPKRQSKTAQNLVLDITDLLYEPNLLSIEHAVLQI